MKATTEDCKDFLSPQYPHLVKDYWTQVTKSSDLQGNIIRVFTHQGLSSPVVISEDAQSGVLQNMAGQPTPVPAVIQQPQLVKHPDADQYFFSVCALNPGDNPGMMEHGVMFVNKTFFKENGCMDDCWDEFLDNLLNSLLQPSWFASDLNSGNMYGIECSFLTAKEMVEYLDGVGFNSSKSFDDLAEGLSMKTVI